MFVTSVSVAQKITIPDLVYMMKTNESGIHELLVKKGWKFNGHFDQTDSSYATTSWVYPAPYENDPKKGLAYIQLCMDIKSINRLEYIFNSKIGFSEIVNYLKAIKAQKLEAMMRENKIIDTYWGKNYVYTIVSGSRILDNGSFNVQIRSKEEYIRQMINNKQD